MHIHILGICGTFMGGIAALAKAAGHRVTGCDAKVYPPMSEQLGQLGIELIEGYSEQQLALKPDLWVVGNVVSRARLANGQPKFALMEAILNNSLPYISGPQWLEQYILRTNGIYRPVLAVAGTHGKTTTSSMLAFILAQAGLEPGFLIGGVPQNFGVSARLGQNNAPFVVEADEYDTAFFDKRSKFIHYHAQTLIINNLEFDHADIFSSLADIQRQFQHLVRTIPSQGQIIYPAGVDSINQVLTAGCWSNTSSFALAKQPAEWQIEGRENDFTIWHKHQQMGRVKWDLIGQHNQLNALAAIIAASFYAIEPPQASSYLTDFKTPKRRMELIAQIKLSAKSEPITIYDDFAHHPTAITTTLAGLRQKLVQTKSTGRIIALFEPRSNTMKLGAQKQLLAQSFNQADFVFCYNQGIDWDVKQVWQTAQVPVVVENNLPELVKAVKNLVQAGDYIVCMSNAGFGGIQQLLVSSLTS